MIRFLRYSKQLSKFCAVTFLFTALFLVVAVQPKSASAGISSVLPGTKPGTVSLKLSSYKATNKFYYTLSDKKYFETTGRRVPKLGSTVPTVPTVATSKSYTLGSNIVYVAAIPVLDVYEVDASLKIVAFKEFTLTTANVAAPVLSISPIAKKGTATASTRLILTAQAGVTFNKLISSKPISALPAIGSTPKGTAYESDTNITGVDPVKNKYIDIYEVGGDGKVVAFKEVILKPNLIAAPDIKNASAVPGAVPGTTILKLTPVKSGNRFYYTRYPNSITENVLGIPVVPGTGTNYRGGAGNLYKAGSSVALGNGISFYLQIYEVDSTNAIVAFKELPISDINKAAPYINATASNISLFAQPGDIPASTKIILTGAALNTLTDTFNIVISSKATSPLPATGSVAKGISYNIETDSNGVITIGNNIVGVDSEKNKYIGIYQVDSEGNTVAFSELVMGKPNLTAPELKSISITTGAGPLTTRLKLTPTKTGNSFKYMNSVALTNLPVLGTQLFGGITYTSGVDLSIGVSSATDLDIYEVDLDDNIVAYSKVTVDAAAIAAPAITIDGVNRITSAGNASPGDMPASTLLALPTIDQYHSYKVLISSKAITSAPTIGDAPKGSAYTLNTSLSPVDETKNKYLDIYEVDENNSTVKFIELTLDSSNMTAPDLK